MKKVHIKSAIPIYLAAALWLIVGLIAPKFLMKLPGLLVTAALSVAAYFVGSKLFPGREVEQQITTGDAAVDREIATARERLENLRKANDAIPDPEISGNLDRMYKAGTQIFNELNRDPKKVGLVRRFMSYYLPTSEKLMEQYQVLMNADTRAKTSPAPWPPSSAAWALPPTPLKSALTTCTRTTRWTSTQRSR